MSKKVTIQDIADALGISRNTVSKAINNSDGIAEETRQKILDKAVEMGYKQFSYVRSLYQMALAGDGEKASAAMLCEISLLTAAHLGSSHFAVSMLDRLQRELNQLGYRLNTYYVSAENIAARSLPFSFDLKKSSAILCIEMFDWDYDRMLCELGVPIVFVDVPACIGNRFLPADQLFMDNRSEISKLTNVLLKKGVRRIGFLGNYMHCESFLERYLTFRSVMMINDVPVDPRFIIPVNNVPELARRLGSLKELPEFFFCTNDFSAVDALQILHRMGKSVPKDVMLCGFDDSPESRMMLPTLTTIHIHSQTMALSAAHLLVTRIKEPNLNFRKVYSETNLILRESTGSVLTEASL